MTKPKIKSQIKSPIRLLILLLLIGYNVLELTFGTIADQWNRAERTCQQLDDSSQPSIEIKAVLVQPEFGLSRSPKGGGNAAQAMGKAERQQRIDNDAINKPLESLIPCSAWHALRRIGAGRSFEGLFKWPHGIVRRAEAIRLLRLEAPHSVQAGQPIRLRCLIEARGDKLQSLSWYKNGREFYRYQPFERRQPVLAFNLAGVNVDIPKSKNYTVVLTNTTSETSGRYKCEVTGTTFQEVHMETYVNVLAASSSVTKIEASSILLLINLLAFGVLKFVFIPSESSTV